MSVKLVCYELSKANPVRRTKLHRELYGYTDVSNHGKYSYKRTGLLNKLNARKVTDAVILVAKQHAQKLISLLGKHGAKTYTFEVIGKIRR